MDIKTILKRGNMGLFDTFIANRYITCRVCGHKEITWQTKELESMMVSYRKGDRLESDIFIEKGWVGVYTNCPNYSNCGQSWEAEAHIVDNCFTGEVIVIKKLEIKGVKE